MIKKQKTMNFIKKGRKNECKNLFNNESFFKSFR